MDSFVGKTIGNYQVIEEIGRGAFTRVYRVWDSKLNRECALKVLQKDAFPPEIYDKARACFEKEARDTAKLHHDAIIKIFDYGEFEETPYIITEFASGGSLDKQLGTKYAENQAAPLIASIADALDYAHSKGILHRDIKPSNILLRKDGSPILTDFGIANMLDERDESGRTLAETSLGIEKAEYIAPEQSMGKPIDGRADQYSLGVIFYEMLTGNKPFSGETPMDIMVQQHTGSFRSPKNDVIGISSDTLKIIEKSLDKDPDARYSSMSEFSTALREISAKRSEKKTPVRKIIATAAVIFLIAAAGIFFLRPVLIPTGQPTLAAERQTATPIIPSRELSTIEHTDEPSPPASTNTPVSVQTDFSEPTITNTSEPTAAMTATSTPDITNTPTATNNATPTETVTSTPTVTATSVPTETPTNTPVPTSTPLAFTIGYGGDFYTLDDAWREFPENAGTVILELDSIKQLDGFISVPDNKGITGLILDAKNKHTVICSGTRLFANGIPLTIGKNLTMSGLTVFGGTYAVGKTDKTVPSSDITIYGTVTDVYGGGEIRGEGSYQGSSIVENANISIFGTVTHNVYGGGYAVGENSLSHVDESRLYLDKWGRINGTLYYGGLASSICPGSGDSCGLEHGIVSMGTVYTDIRGEVLNGVRRSSFSTGPADPEKTLYYAPFFEFLETEDSQEQTEAPEPVRQEMLIAWGQDCADLSCAMSKIAPETTDLLIKIGGSFVQYYSITIPNEGNALQQVTIDADAPVTVTMQNLGIYANGIKLTIGKNITLQGSIIYAGGNADNGRNNKESAELVIDGTVGTVYAGGAAGCPNCTANVRESTVTITGNVANSVYGGGFAAEKGARADNEITTLILTNTSMIRQNLYFGGYAVNYCDPAKRGTPEECDHAGSVSVGTVKAAVYGKVNGDINESGFSVEGAPSAVSDIIYIEAPEAEMMDLTDPQVLRIGDFEEHRTVRHALQSIRYPGGEVILQLTGKLSATEDVIIPTNKAIRSVRIESDRENAVRTLDLNNRMLCANGIPLTIGTDVTILNGPVTAGGRSNAGTLLIPEAKLTINGTIISNVYGGGAAVCSSTLTESCTSNVENSQLYVNGNVQGNIYLGGLTMGSGSKADVTGTVRITMTNPSRLRGNLYFTGNPLSGKNPELVSYCEFNKLKNGVCSSESLSTAAMVNRAEAALYGDINGSVISAELTGSSNTTAILHEYAYIETEPGIMNLEDPQLIRIGPGESRTTLPAALENIRYSAEGTDVILTLSGNLYLNENIELPFEKNIKSLRIETDRPGVNRTIDLGNKYFFACGVPLTIGENIFMTNTSLYAGKLMQAETEEEARQREEKSVSADTGKITILGSAANVYAGGRAVGPGTESLVGASEIDIQGAIQQSVYGGGAAINGARSAVNEVMIKIGPEAKIGANISCGGLAEFSRDKDISENDSLSEVNAVTIINNGEFSSSHIFEQGVNNYGGISSIGSISYQ